jgi:integrase/recombinase XerC
LGKETVKAIEEWLKVRGNVNKDEPLFCAIHRGYWGHQLNTDLLEDLL